MTWERSPRQFDAREEGKGHADASQKRVASDEDSDSPAKGSLSGPSAPEAPSDSKSDGVDELKRMEENAEDGRE
jgi:hypothetical protein